MALEHKVKKIIANTLGINLKKRPLNNNDKLVDDLNADPRSVQLIILCLEDLICVCSGDEDEDLGYKHFPLLEDTLTVEGLLADNFTLDWKPNKEELNTVGDCIRLIEKFC